MSADTAAAQHRRIEPFILCITATAVLVASGIAPHDRLTWELEISWVAVGIPILILTYRRFPLTPLLYRLLFIHAVILIIGGYYTYARVPFGFWAGELFHWTRNNYDRLGHFVQGFVPAILAREILIRRLPLHGSRWLPLIVVCICLAFSAFFELLEWAAAVIYGGGATAYLATQGDPWDTQWDMLWAIIGAVTSLVTLSRVHDRQVAALVKG